MVWVAYALLLLFLITKEGTFTFDVFSTLCFSRSCRPPRHFFIVESCCQNFFGNSTVIVDDFDNVLGKCSTWRLRREASEPHGDERGLASIPRTLARNSAENDAKVVFRVKRGGGRPLGWEDEGW